MNAATIPMIAASECARAASDVSWSLESVLRPNRAGWRTSACWPWVAICKYCDRILLYRQSVIYARDGVDLDRSLLADWIDGKRVPIAIDLMHCGELTLLP